MRSVSPLLFGLLFGTFCVRIWLCFHFWTCISLRQLKYVLSNVLFQFGLLFQFRTAIFLLKLTGAIFSSECFMNGLGRFCSFPLHLYCSLIFVRSTFWLERITFLIVCWHCFACIICSLVCRTFCLLWTIWLGRLSLFFNFLLSLEPSVCYNYLFALEASASHSFLECFSHLLFLSVDPFYLYLFISHFWTFCRTSLFELSVFH